MAFADHESTIDENGTDWGCHAAARRGYVMESDFGWCDARSAAFLYSAGSWCKTTGERYNIRRG